VTSIGSNAFNRCFTNSITCYATTAPTIENKTFIYVRRGGTLYYPTGSDYSTWLSTEPDYLGYYDWNGVEIEPEPETEPVICKYNVTTTEPITICNTTDSFSDILYNGVSIGLVTEYQFSSLNEHTLEFILEDKTSIGDYAFYGCSGLTSIVIPDSVTTIGEGAFYDCRNLTSVTIGSGVTSIGSYAFAYCTGLKEIVIPNSVTSIGNNAFSNCTGLKDIVIPNSVTSIGNNAFYDCNGLTSVVISNSVTSIGKNTFYGCTGLKDIVIPDSVTSIGSSAFGNCDSLTSVVIPDSVTSIGSSAFGGCNGLTSVAIPNSVTTIGNFAFYGCSGLKDIAIPDSVTQIGEQVFAYCENLTSIVIPDSVTSIGNKAFGNCYSLNSITCYATTAPTITISTFQEVARGGTLYYPKGSDYSFWLITEPHYLGYYGWNGVEVHPEPETEPVICKYNAISTTDSVSICYTTDSFSDILYNGVSIGVTTEYAFPSTGEHTLEFILGDKTSIDDYAFYKCSGLTSIVIPDSVTSISEYAFYYCTGLTSIVIPDSVTTISDSAFSGCKSLTSVTIGSGVTTMGKHTFYGCSGLTSIVIPDSVTSIGDYAFNYCEILTSVTIGSGVTSIGDYAFSDSASLSKITCYATTAPTIANKTFRYIKRGGTLYYPKGSDYSFWLITEPHYLGYYGWNGVDDVPDVPPTPDEPTYIEPEIRLYKTRLDYTSDGGDKYVQIDYYGATTILEPTCTQSWVTIKKTQSGRKEEDGVRVDQHQYRITMEPTNFARNINVVFSCTDVNGVVFKDSHLMLYQSAPVATPTIVVSKNNINLDNVGDTSVIQVTYINVDEIVPPEVPDGFTIEEIERVESEKGIQVKYKVTRISPKRLNAQINFKGNNTSSGESATSGNVTLRGKPVPAEVKVTTIWPKKDDYFLIEEQQDCHIDFRVTNFNSPYEMSYSINDSNNSIYLRKSKESTLDNELYLSYDFKSLPNNTNNPFTGTIDFTYKDELTDYSVSIPFYVNYANEGRIEAGSEKYAYDKDGKNLNSTNGNRFSMSYFNMETINEPECDVDWLTVGEGVLDTGVYVDERVKYNHLILIKPNEGNSRRCTVTFSGKGVDGKDYTFDIEVTQEGKDTVKPLDEGYIELQQLSVTLNADGGAQTFQVKYYDAKTIYEPELAGTWASISEVSRTEPVPDTAWNGEECESVIVTYKATAQPTDSGRQMKVKFKSDINYYNDSVVVMEKDKFIIYQLAEGSTEVQGDVVILRYSNTFTYYGTPTGWDFRVAYKNVVPDTPLISESWCRIAEVKDLNADEYDYYKEYILEMDTNNSNFGRTCTITFIGNAEDGTQIKIPFQFTQQGQEEIVNEGEYDNYKGYFMDFEGALHSVSFITNPRSDVYGDIRLAGDSPVVVSYSENGYLYDPIRTSTCTVKVVSSHYLMNLYSGKAQGTQVILRNEDRDTIEWCGFLQPNLYNQGFTECIEEIEFEASDCLSTLQYLRYEYFYNGNGQPMIVSFKNIVDTIADRCKLINSYVFTQKLFSNSDESKIFDFKEFYISENNFYSEEGEPWTYQEVLEEICKYFGYVCFQWGDRIYFMDYDKYNSDKSMVGYRYSKDDRWYNRNYITLSNPNIITEKSIRGTGADISLDDVFNKVSVNCNYYNLEHLLPDLFEDDLLTERNQMTLTTVVNRGQEIGSKTSYIVYDHKNIKSHFYKPIVGENIHEVEAEPTEDEFNSRSFFKDFIGANIVNMYYLNYSDLNNKTFESKEWEKYLMISQLNRPWCKGPIVGEYDTTKYWENYNFPIMEFTQIPQIFIDNHKEVYESNTTTGGRVPSTRAGMGTSSTTPNSRPSINTNKSEHYLVIRAEAAFTPYFSEAYVPENVEERGFKRWSNTEYGNYTFDLIKGTTKKEQNFTPKLTFYLEIPTAGWWDGSKWVDYETWFEVPLEELHYSDEVWYSWKNTQNKVETNLFLGVSGYKIQLPESMESTAFMQFKIGMPKRFAHVTGGDDNGEAGNAFCFIKNLEMDIVSRNTALLKDEDMCFENVIDDNNVVDGPEWDIKITSDNNITYSFSTVSTKYGEDMVNTTNFRFYDLEGELILPEEAIINKFVNQYSTPTLKENMTVDMSFTPAQMVTDTYWGDGKNFVIVGQELDYKQCSQQITILEKK
jgi:hypothetical protein